VIADEVSRAEVEAKRRVLIVDDDRDFAESLHNYLLLEGYEVRMAFSAAQARQAIEDFDAQVAILDYRLGPTLGVDLVAPLKQRRPGIVCILATAFGDMDAVVSALRSGVYDYFGKPLHTDELLLTLDRCFELLRLQQEKQAAVEALREAEKMAAVAQVAGGVAHHLNNLLMIMLGNAERLKVRMEDDPDQAKLADDLMGAIERAADINHSLVTFTRRQVLRAATVDLNTVLSGMKDDFRRVLGEAVQTQVVTSSGLWQVSVDPAQLELALLNVARNAGEAMPEGGNLIVTAANLDEPGAAGDQRHGLSPGQYVVLTLSDTGTGMAPEVAERAFEPFFSGQSLAEKVGLGLSVVYGFAKQSGGSVTLDSALGRGTTVRLYLPRAQAADGAVKAPRA
jgi:signal transduction histidine kinase